MDNCVESEAAKYAEAMKSQAFKDAKQKANEILAAALDKTEDLGVAVVRSYRVGQQSINLEVEKGLVWFAPKIGHLNKFTESNPENN